MLRTFRHLAADDFDTAEHVTEFESGIDPVEKCRLDVLLPENATAARYVIRSDGEVIGEGEGTSVDLDILALMPELDADDLRRQVEVRWNIDVPNSPHTVPFNPPLRQVPVTLPDGARLRCEDGTDSEELDYLRVVDAGVQCTVEAQQGGQVTVLQADRLIETDTVIDILTDGRAGPIVVLLAP